MEASKALNLDRLTKKYLGEDEYGHLRCLVCDKIFKFKSKDTALLRFRGHVKKHD